MDALARVKVTDPVTKAQLRRVMRRRRAALTLAEQSLAALALERRLLRIKDLWATDSVGGSILLGTLSHRGEIDAGPFLSHWLESGRGLALPKVGESDHQLEVRLVQGLIDTGPGFRGIREPDLRSTKPIPAQSVQAMLIPGLAFDIRGCRLGQGGGHYDRFLHLANPRAFRIGIAHDFQILTRIPAIEGVDEVMDFVVSPFRVIDCRVAGGRLAPG